jgi:hypothetical protein
MTHVFKLVYLDEDDTAHLHPIWRNMMIELDPNGKLFVDECDALFLKEVERCFGRLSQIDSGSYTEFEFDTEEDLFEFKLRWS